jgi:hypothetical protein
MSKQRWRCSFHLLSRLITTLPMWYIQHDIYRIQALYLVNVCISPTHIGWYTLRDDVYLTCGPIISTKQHEAIIFMFLLRCKFTWANPFSHHTTMVLTSSKILWATHFIVAIGDAYIHECELYWLYKIFELMNLKKTWSCKTNL